MPPRPDAAGQPEGMTAARRALFRGSPLRLGPAPRTTPHPFPAAPLWDRGRPGQGRLRAAARPGLRPGPGPARPLTHIGSYRGTGHTRPRPRRPRASSIVPATVPEAGIKPDKPAPLTRPAPSGMTILGGCPSEPKVPWAERSWACRPREEFASRGRGRRCAQRHLVAARPGRRLLRPAGSRGLCLPQGLWQVQSGGGEGCAPASSARGATPGLVHAGLAPGPDVCYLGGLPRGQVWTGSPVSAQWR
jgi:hypothetical protein